MIPPNQFNKAVKGTGIGIEMDKSRDLLRIPERGDDQHFKIIGNIGSGGDIVRNPLDRRCSYWGPSEEFVRRVQTHTLQ